MKKNNKGFTLVELLTTIVLISLLIGIGIPGVMKISERMKARNYKVKVDLIEQAGTLWGQDNKTLLQTDNCDLDNNLNTGTEGKEYKCHLIKINDLIIEDYLEADGNNKDESENTGYEYIDPITNDNIVNNCVWVYKKNNRVYSKYGINCEGKTEIE